MDETRVYQAPEAGGMDGHDDARLDVHIPGQSEYSFSAGAVEPENRWGDVALVCGAPRASVNTRDIVVILENDEAFRDIADFLAELERMWQDISPVDEDWYIDEFGEPVQCG